MSDEARLRWRCRRGMRELDQLLGWYLAARFPQAGVERRAAFVELLDQPDPDLWGWLIGREQPPRADWHAIVDEIRASDRL
jgi:antitoxin CptB